MSVAVAFCRECAPQRPTGPQKGMGRGGGDRDALHVQDPDAPLTRKQAHSNLRSTLTVCLLPCGQPACASRRALRQIGHGAAAQGHRPLDPRCPSAAHDRPKPFSEAMLPFWLASLRAGAGDRSGNACCSLCWLLVNSSGTGLPRNSSSSRRAFFGTRAAAHRREEIWPIPARSVPELHRHASSSAPLNVGGFHRQ